MKWSLSESTERELWVKRLRLQIRSYETAMRQYDRSRPGYLDAYKRGAPQNPNIYSQQTPYKLLAALEAGLPLDEVRLIKEVRDFKVGYCMDFVFALVDEKGESYRFSGIAGPREALRERVIIKRVKSVDFKRIAKYL